MRANTYYDAIDTRIVFKAYAALAWTVGALLYAWGGRLFPTPLAGLPHADGVAARIAGAVLLGAGFLSIAMARTHDDDGRRRAMGWWAVGHDVALAGIGLQILGGHRLRPTWVGRTGDAWDGC